MTAALARELPRAARQGGLFLRLARVFLLLLILTLPLEAITAVREMALVGAALFLAVHLWLTGESRFRPTVLVWPLALYVASAAFSLLTAVDAGYSLGELRAEVLKGLIAFYLGVHFVREEEHLAQAWGGLLATAAVMAVFGVALFWQAGGSLLTHYVRAGSLHSGYGTFATFLVTVWPFVLLAPRQWPGARLRPLWIGLIALCAFSGYLTFSRAAWVAMLVELGLLAVLLSRRRLLTGVGFGAAGVCLVAALLVLVPGARHGERWQQLWENPAQVGGTAGDLIAAWRHSLGEIADHPFRGIGLGRHSFSKAYPDFRARHQPLLWHAHNMFIELALQIGVQGLFAILWAFAALVAVLWPHAPPRRGDAAGLFGLATAVMVVGFSVRNLADDFFVDDSALLFWLLAGLALGGRWLGRRGGEKNPWTPPRGGC
jgi:O-antigen ligase